MILSWGVVRLAAPDNCINSTFVEKIDIIEKGRISSVENCSLYSRVFGTIVPERSFAHNLIKRINQFERAAFVWQRPLERINLIVSEDPMDLNVKGQELIIGRARLNKGVDLELGLLSLTSPQKDPLIREVIARFFWSLIAGGEFKLRPWPTYIKTLAGYCRDDQHLLVHREFCDLRKELGDGLISEEVDEGAVGWSLLPLLTDTLKQTYARIPSADRLQFLERVFFLGSFEDESLFSPELRTLADIEERYFELLRLWLLPIGIDSAVFESIRRDSSLYSQSYVYIVNNSGEELELPNSDLRHALIETGNKKTFSLSDVNFNISRAQVFNNLDVKEVILVGCKIPAPRRLLEFSPWVKKVFFIQKCKDQTLDLAGLVDEGALKYAVKHSQLKVFEFNLRSLRVAQEWQGPLRGSSFADWRQWLNWNTVTYDSNRFFLRPLGKFDAISRFHDPEQNKLSAPVY
jgi:hypothetical protein